MTELAQSKTLCDCIGTGSVKLACGRKMPIVMGSCQKLTSINHLPVVQGILNGHVVNALRDTGCTGIAVRKSLVNDEQFVGKSQTCMLIDGSVVKVPIAKVHIDTPYFSGEVTAMCMKEPIYDLVIGNVDGARPVDEPDTKWSISTANAVMTRAGVKKLNKMLKPLHVANVSGDVETVDVEKFTELQQNDPSVQKLKTKTEKRKMGKKYSWFQTKNKLLYRYVSDSNGRTAEQLIVPKELRPSIMKVAHDSIFGGHMGIRKTLNRIFLCFFWTGIEGDVKRFCRSCDVCQRTIDKGRVCKVPLGETPIIDVPFKRIAVDLVGPIHPVSDNGYRYILTVIDYATKFPEAIPLKQITTEVVAEALVSIFSRGGIPEEMLSDLGSQFTADLMKELTRLLSIRRLTTTPYHPMANGLVEKMNATIKSMLKKLTIEKPKDWDRYLIPLLFAYREVPNDSSGYSPFELLYGRSVRGPMHILKECWSNDTINGDIKNSYQYVLDLKNRLEETCELAKSELQKSKQRYTKYYNLKARNRSLKPDDQVLIMLPTDHNKLLLQWKGPFKVIEKVNPYDYKLDINGKVKTFHINMLKQYIARDQDQAASLTVTMQTLFQAISAASVNIEDTNDELCFDFTGSKTPSKIDMNGQLSVQQINELQSVINNYSSVFSDAPGCTDLIAHRIKVTSDIPVKVKPYPIPYAVRQTINE